MLAQLDVAVVDCQASGANPRHGSLLEMGWTITGPRAADASVEACWLAPPRAPGSPGRCAS